jgi:hypothetical protein
LGFSDWHTRHVTERMSDDELRDILDDFDRAGIEIQRLQDERLDRRDKGLQRARDTGWRPSELERFTGLSGEAIRQALNPEKREAARRALAERRAAAKAGKPS